MKSNLAIQLFTTCFVIGAIVVALWFAPAISGAETVEIGANKAFSEITQTEARSETVETRPSAVSNKPSEKEVLSGTTIVGVEASIDMRSAKIMESDVNALWLEFREKEALHQNVNWASKPMIYAHYHDIDRAFTTAKLFIGYASDVLQLSSLERTHSIPQNNYQIKRAINQSELMQQWQSITYPVSDVIERYTLGSNGDITSIDFLHAK
ncbi:MAG: hypothetical protein KUG73_11880 [Pseudomonadales bacterium]|nr:hypothetical protein [Pseudomonadales bacterium]